MYWTIPRHWEGLTVAVLASGPSMSQTVADKVRHLPRIAVNDTYRLAPDADAIYAGDASWWRRNPEALQCQGRKLTIEPLPGVRPDVPFEVQILQNTGREGFDSSPSCLRTHNNGGMQAVQVAIHAGAMRILLLGFDMRGGRWYESTEAPTSAKQFGIWIHRARALAEAVYGIVDIVNCAEDSALDCFRRQSLDGALLFERLAA